MAQDTVDQRLLATKIMIGALLNGLVMMGLLAYFVQIDPLQPDFINILSIVGGVLMLLAVAAQFVVVPMVESAFRERQAAEPTDSDWAGLYHTRTIVGAALLEGVAMYFLIVFLLGRQEWVLGAAVAMILVMAALHFPTRDRFDSWMVRQRQLWQERRMNG